MEALHADEIRKAIGGDLDALTVLLEHYGPIVRRRLVVSRKWAAVLDADDVMQVTYLEAFMRIAGFDGSRAEAFEAWLGRIAENNLKDAVKALSAQKRPQPSQRLRAAAGEGRSTQQLLLELADSSAKTAGSCVASLEGERMLLDAIEALPTDYGRVVKMFDLEGRNAAEVAAALGRSAGAVYMLRARAHDRLREMLGPPSRYLSVASVSPERSVERS